MENKDNIQLALKIAKAIGYTEHGGKPDLKNLKSGKTGEMKSIFQYTPDTWRAYSKHVAGKELPLTHDNETIVTAGKVKEWLDKGYKPEQIFSMWNAGVGEPNAYTGKFSDGTSSTGTNHKYGVAYSVPHYVSTAMNYYKEFDNQQDNQQSENSTPMTSSPIPQQTQKLGEISSPMQNNQLTGLLSSLIPKS